MNFGLIGAAGYIAPRHMKAMKALDGTLQTAFDPNDSVGVMDSYFPAARFFVDFERFAEHVSSLMAGKDRLDYIAVCSPNYLHRSHANYALQAGADVICEKPLVLNPNDLDALIDEASPFPNTKALPAVE